MCHAVDRDTRDHRTTRKIQTKSWRGGPYREASKASNTLPSPSEPSVEVDMVDLDDRTVVRELLVCSVYWPKLVFRRWPSRIPGRFKRSATIGPCVAR
jgi:hypothetical protein